MNGMTRKEVTLQKRGCDSCRYKHKAPLTKPCKDGIMQVIFEGVCHEYEPNLMARLWYWLKGLVK